MAHTYTRKPLKSAKRSQIESHGDNKYGKGGAMLGWAKQVMRESVDKKRRALVEKMNNKRKEK